MAFVPLSITSGLPLLLSNVETFFGNTSLTLYGARRGGPNLPLIANTYTGVSTTTPTLSSLADLSYPPIRFSGANNNTTALSAAPATAGVTVWGTSDPGIPTVWFRATNSPSGSGTYNVRMIYEATSVVDYDIRFLKTGGTVTVPSSGSSLNTWYNLATTGSRFWGIETNGSGGFNQVTLSGYIQVRMNASPQTLINETHVSMTATQSL